MAVPKRRQSTSRTGRRRAHQARTPMQLQACSQCRTPVPSHVVCPNCGNYQGRVIVEPKT